MYRIGEGVERDPKQAAKWYAMGGAKGDVQALKWTILAAHDDGEYDQELFDRAKRPRKQMSERLPPDQVGEAKRAARSWQANRVKK